MDLDWNVEDLTTRNFGFIGCYTDVLEMMDRRCTGRTSCDVDVIEPNFDDIRPCNVELKSYLQANYICIAGIHDSASPGSRQNAAFSNSRPRVVRSDRTLHHQPAKTDTTVAHVTNNWPGTSFEHGPGLQGL